MNAKLKKKWLTALRGGKYKQGTHQLRLKPQKGPDQFCCLGVLCDIVGKKEWSVGGGNLIDGAGYVYFRGSCALPPLSLKEEVGLSNIEVANLANLNDVSRLSFKKIADYIEKNILSEE